MHLTRFKIGNFFFLSILLYFLLRFIHIIILCQARKCYYISLSLKVKFVFWFYHGPIKCLYNLLEKRIFFLHFHIFFYFFHFEKTLLNYYIYFNFWNSLFRHNKFNFQNNSLWKLNFTFHHRLFWKHNLTLILKNNFWNESFWKLKSIYHNIFKMIYFRNYFQLETVFKMNNSENKNIHLHFCFQNASFQKLFLDWKELLK